MPSLVESLTRCFRNFQNTGESVTGTGWGRNSNYAKSRKPQQTHSTSQADRCIDDHWIRHICHV